MTTPPTKGPAPIDDETVSWPNVVKFTRQLSHDVRNGLNALDLEAAFISELNADPEIAEELKKLRAMVVGMTRILHGVTSYMGTFSMNTIELEADILMGEIREQLTKLYPEGMAEVAWSGNPGSEPVEVDVARFAEAMRAIFENAFQFRDKGQPIAFTCGFEGGRLVMELREGKSSPVEIQEWSAPLFTTRRGGYGLGLFHAGRVLDAHKGELKTAFDAGASALITRMSLPLKK